MNDDISSAVNILIKKQNLRKEQEELAHWQAVLDATPIDTKRVPLDGWIADIELQPTRWLSAGFDLLESAHVLTRAKNMDGSDGAVMQSILPYSIFQSGTEVFLKGMWLCQFEDCRQLTQSSYITPERRRELGIQLVKLGHNLLKIIETLRALLKYRDDEVAMQFLARVSAVIRQDYYPLHVADERAREWAHSRYPKRFYQDTKKEGHADAFQRYSQQRLIVALFKPLAPHLRQLWDLPPHRRRPSPQRNPSP
jgi:hypothetical protein